MSLSLLHTPATLNSLFLLTAGTSPPQGLSTCSSVCLEYIPPISSPLSWSCHQLSFLSDLETFADSLALVLCLSVIAGQGACHYLIYSIFFTCYCIASFHYQNVSSWTHRFHWFYLQSISQIPRSINGNGWYAISAWDMNTAWMSDTSERQGHWKGGYHLKRATKIFQCAHDLITTWSKMVSKPGRQR